MFLTSTGVFCAENKRQIGRWIWHGEDPSDAVVRIKNELYPPRLIVADLLGCAERSEERRVGKECRL